MFAAKGGNEKKRSSESNEVVVAIVASVVEVSLVCISSYFLYNWMMKMQKKQIDGGGGGDQNAARARLANLLKKREEEKLSGKDFDEKQMKQVLEQIVHALDLNEYEAAISEDVIDPAYISTTFKDVGGIDHVKVNAILYLFLNSLEISAESQTCIINP